MSFLDLFGHEVIHFLLSIAAAAVAALFFWKTAPRKQKKSAALYLLMLAGGFIGEFLLDADHLFDYILAFGLNFRIGKFLGGEMFDKSHKIILPLHSWELLVIMVIVVLFIKNKKWKYFLLAITIGMFFHLVYDQFYNNIQPLGYSWFWRLAHNFSENSATIH